MQAIFVIISTLFFLILSGCGNPFETRTAQPPSQNQSKWEQPVSPHNVLLNFKNAYEEQSIENYLQSLDSTFVFEADPFEREGTSGDIYENWDFEVEAEVTRSLFTTFSLGSIRLDFIDIADKPDPPDPSISTIIYREYVLSINDQNSSIPPTNPAQGTAILTLIENEYGFWQISYWEDSRTEDTIDWGAVKGEFRL